MSANAPILTLPEQCLVLLIGPSGVGKSTFARKHFRGTEILSTDFFRGMVSDDESNQSASKDAFEVLHLAAEKRLLRGRLTVIDATNLEGQLRKPFLELARTYYFPVTAIVFQLPEEVCQKRNQVRQERTVPESVIRKHCEKLSTTIHSLNRERYKQIRILTSQQEIDTVTIERKRSPVNVRYEHGPFDIIGDVHGCFRELLQLFVKLGYCVTTTDVRGFLEYRITPPPGRKVIFVGDLVDRGPGSPQVLRIVMNLMQRGLAYCVRGNHDDKLFRKLCGRKVSVTYGLGETLNQMQQEPLTFHVAARDFLDSLPHHLILNSGRLVVAHAGLPRPMHGRMSKRVRNFALYGDITGDKDEHGLPVRGDWAQDYTSKPLVVYGHTPVEFPRWVNNTVNVDTGCVFGGMLTALRYPELETVSVAAEKVHCPPHRPFKSDDAVSPVS